MMRMMVESMMMIMNMMKMNDDVDDVPRPPPPLHSPTNVGERPGLCGTHWFVPIPWGEWRAGMGTGGAGRRQEVTRQGGEGMIEKHKWMGQAWRLGRERGRQAAKQGGRQAGERRRNEEEREGGRGRKGRRDDVSGG